MITIQIKDDFLDVYPNFSDFRITFRNLAFGLYSSFIFDFSVPVTAKNMRLLNYPIKPNRFDKSKQKIDALAQVYGKLQIDGYLTVGQATEKNIELSFSFIAADFINQIENKKLNELADFDETINFSTKYLMDCIQLSWPETPVNFPSVYNPEFYGDKNPYFLGVINNVQGGLVPADYNENTVIPMLYLPEIVKRVFSSAGYTVLGKIFENDLFKTAILYNNFALDKLLSVYFYGKKQDYDTTNMLFWRIPFDENMQTNGSFYNPTFAWYTFQITGSYRLKGVIIHKPGFTPGPYDEFSYTLRLRTNLDEDIVAPFTDVFFDGEVIETTNTFNVEFVIETTGVHRVWVEVYYESYGVIRPANVVNSWFEIAGNDIMDINVLQDQFNIKNHVPDMDSIDFIEAVMHDFALVPIFDKINKQCILVTWDDFINQKGIIDYNNTLIRNTLKVDQNDFEGIQFKFKNDGPDKYSNFDEPINVEGNKDIVTDLITELQDKVFFIKSLNAWVFKQWKTIEGTFEYYYIFEYLSDNLQPFDVLVNNQFKEIIEFSFSPMKMRYFTHDSQEGRNMPGINAGGTSEAYNIKNDFPLRIMFDVGIDTASGVEGTEFLRATTTMMNELGNEIKPYMVDITPQNWVKTFWNTKLLWLKSRVPIDASLKLSVQDLTQIDLSKIANIMDAPMIIQEMYVKPSLQSVRAEIKGFTI